MGFNKLNYYEYNFLIRLNRNDKLRSKLLNIVIWIYKYFNIAFLLKTNI